MTSMQSKWPQQKFHSSLMNDCSPKKPKQILFNFCRVWDRNNSDRHINTNIFLVYYAQEQSIAIFQLEDSFSQQPEWLNLLLCQFRSFWLLFDIFQSSQGKNTVESSSRHGQFDL